MNDERVMNESVVFELYIIIIRYAMRVRGTMSH